MSVSMIEQSVNSLHDQLTRAYDDVNRLRNGHSKSDDGLTAVEYAVMVALIIIVCLFATTMIYR
jgi:hypothetical protein